jgi:UDP-N-acetyl-D-galactosamine dehydrogenase
MDYSIQVHVVDPNGSPNELAHEYGISLVDQPLGDYDIILLAVGHKEYLQMKVADFEKLSKDELYMYDIKGVLNPNDYKNYWRL